MNTAQSYKQWVVYFAAGHTVFTLLVKGLPDQTDQKNLLFPDLEYLILHFIFAQNSFFLT